MVQTFEADILRSSVTNPLVAGDLANDSVGRHSGLINGTVEQYASDDSVAMWTSATRYYAVDYDGGLDTNVGYSDVSMAAAGVVALKTLERLRQIFPKFGNGRICVIAIKARAAGATYRNIANSADDDFFFFGVHGYFQLIIRGTGTVATAGATAFANDLADKRCCGARIFAGTNAAGYNPTGVPTNNTFTCQLNGGGAPGLTAEPALVGKRIRFDSATPTVALQNACSMIWLNTATSITTATNLPAVPALTDIFYIEEPGVAVAKIVIHTSNPSNTIFFTQFGLQVVGMRAVSATAPALTIRGCAALVNLSFIDIPLQTGFSAAACTGPNDLRFTSTYTDEITPTPTTITTGVGVRCEGGATTTTIASLTINSSANIQARFQMINVLQFSVGAGSYSSLGVLVQGCGVAPSSTTIGGVVIGNAGSASIRRLRTTSTFSESINVSRSHCVLHGIDATGCAGTPIINVNGIGLAIAINDVVGSTGNTLTGLNLANARDCRIMMGTIAANTFTATAGQDIAAAGPVYYVHADYARTDLRDANGNHIQGTGLSIVGPTTAVTNNAVANIGQYAVVRATASGLVQAAQANLAVNAAGVVGVSQGAFTAAGPQLAMVVNGGATWVQFDAGPAAGGTAYLSTVTAGNATDVPPPLLGANQKLRLGRILRVSGTLGLVMWHPESLPVLADGLA